MNADQKKRATELLSAWRATAYALHADRMADLLQEMVDAPEVLAATNPAQISSSTEPCAVCGKKAPEVKPAAWVLGYYAGYLSVATVDGRILPTGTALYTAPTPAEPPADVARDAERLDWLLRKLPGFVLRYCVGVLSDTSDGKEFREAIDAAIKRQGGE